MHEESLSDQNVEMKLELPMQSPPIVAKRPVGRRQAFARAFREPIDRRRGQIDSGAISGTDP
jgi:hypothetical protein